jgi:hypothetical protein
MTNSLGVPLSLWEITRFPVGDKAVSQDVAIRRVLLRSWHWPSDYSEAVQFNQHWNQDWYAIPIGPAGSFVRLRMILRA